MYRFRGGYAPNLYTAMPGTAHLSSSRLFLFCYTSGSGVRCLPAGDSLSWVAGLPCPGDEEPPALRVISKYQLTVLERPTPHGGSGKTGGVFIYIIYICDTSTLARFKFREGVTKRTPTFGNSIPFWYTKKKGVYVGPPKTGQPRAVCLAPETIDVLKKWKTEQLRTRIRHADIWQDTGFVFTKDNGTPMHPDSITDWLNKFSV